MITIIENTNFVEGIFFIRNDAEKYLLDHPKRENCLVKELMIEDFPLYVLEINFGKFIYISTKDGVINFIKEVDMNEITKKKSTIFKIDKNNGTEVEEINEESITIYVIKEPFMNEIKNKDTMGIFTHYHIKKNELMEIKNGNYCILNI
jgi:hypothetical protein